MTTRPSTTPQKSAARVHVDRESVIEAAIDLLYEDGFHAVTMRGVAGRLGVSPIPLYTKVGDKDALIAAVAERLLGRLEVDVEDGASWTDQAEQWAHLYRQRLKSIPDRDLLLNNQRRDVSARCTRPLLKGLRSAGLTRAQAVRVCRMLMWTTNGFVFVESGVEKLDAHFEPAGDGIPPAGHTSGVTQADIDNLFATQIRFAVEGLRREVESS
jgi:TetR/AcrR family transcriptional regulator, tetracycline repressor protein